MNPIRATRRGAVALSLSALLTSVAADPTVLPAPGQPAKSGSPGTFEIVGNSGVSAQQLFLGNEGRVYIVDKTENNPPKVNRWPTVFLSFYANLSAHLGRKPFSSCMGH